MTVARLTTGTGFGLQIRSGTTPRSSESPMEGTRPMTVRAVALTVGLTLAAGSAAALVGCSNHEPAPAANHNANRAAPAPAPAGPSDPSAPQEVNFSTEDGVMITGDLYLPEKTPAPAVLALHQWESDRAAYRDFARLMREAGFV